MQPELQPQRVASQPVRLPAHLPALDGLRGVAILLVVVHMLGLLEAPAGLAAHAVGFVMGVGWIGVQLFFVLSGFLITGILVDTQDAANHFSAFYGRRTLRIFPLYYATLFVAFAILPALGWVGPALAHDRQHQIWLWTYLTNWVSPGEAGSRAFPHFWSLAVEEQFYLVWPFLLRGRSPVAALRLCLAVAAVGLAARIGMVAGGVSFKAIYTFSVSRMDALALGGATAAAFRVPSLAAAIVDHRRRLWLIALGLGVAGAIGTHGYATERIAGAAVGYTILSITFALMVAAAAADDAVRGRGAAALRARPLVALGKYSYGLYVLHKPLHDFVGKPLLARLGLDPRASLLVASGYVACGLAAAFVAAFLSYQLFERHFLRAKRYFAFRPLPR